MAILIPCDTLGSWHFWSLGFGKNPNLILVFVINTKRTPLNNFYKPKPPNPVQAHSLAHLISPAHQHPVHLPSPNNKHPVYLPSSVKQSQHLPLQLAPAPPSSTSAYHPSPLTIKLSSKSFNCSPLPSLHLDLTDKKKRRQRSILTAKIIPTQSNGWDLFRRRY